MEPTPSRTARTAYLVLTVIFWISVVIAVFVVTYRLFGVSGLNTIVVPAGLEANVELPEGFEVAGPLPVSIDVAEEDLTPSARLIGAVPSLVRWALILGVLWLLRGIARSAAKGDPFQSSNLTRLRWLGALFLLGFPLGEWVERTFTEWFFSAGVWAGEPIPLGGIRIESPLVAFPAILAGISLFALAEVFAYGVRLREDVDATI